MNKCRANTIYGQILLPDSEDDLIRRSLENLGEWGYIEALILEPLLESNDVVFDLGAYIGTFSLGMSGVGNIKKILAVEPNHSSVELLEANLTTNCDIPFDIANYAMGFEAGYAIEDSCSSSNLGARTYSHIQENGAEKQDPVPGNIIEQRTLKQLRQQFGSYDVVKLDIEGAECDALRSDGGWIRENKPVVWAECNESPGVRQLLQFFTWAELSPMYIAYPAFRKRNFKESDWRPFPIAYEAALLGGSSGRLEKLRLENLGEGIICIDVNTYESLREAMWLTPRWGKAEWTDLSCPELVALLGRYATNQNYDEFMVQGRDCN